jgi:hypothetical protein
MVHGPTMAGYPESVHGVNISQSDEGMPPLFRSWIAKTKGNSTCLSIRSATKEGWFGRRPSLDGPAASKTKTSSTSHKKKKILNNNRSAVEEPVWVAFHGGQCVQRRQRQRPNDIFFFAAVNNKWPILALPPCSGGIQIVIVDDPRRRADSFLFRTDHIIITINVRKIIIT